MSSSPRKTHKLSSSPQYQSHGATVEQFNWNKFLDATNEDDYLDYPELSLMSPIEKDIRIKELWKKAYLKSKAAGLLLKQVSHVKTKIEIFGRHLLPT